MFRLDRFEHIRRVLFIGTDQRHELPVPVEHRPETCRLAERCLAAAARHCHCEETAFDDCLFDLGDDLQMVFRPRQVEREREVPLAEGPEVMLTVGLALRIDNIRQLADVPAGERQRDVARPGAFTMSVVSGELKGA